MLTVTVDGVTKQLRNQQEQVAKNHDDITYILEEEGTLNEFGIKVIGHLDTADELPDASTYEGEYGDAYAIGTETPYALYIFTREFSGYTGDHWFDIGDFPLAGPQGEVGPQGEQGIQGIDGSYWYTGTSSTPSTVVSSPREKDCYLDASTGYVYQYTGSVWSNVGSIRGPQGIQGIQGIQGVQGVQGPQGPTGEKGDVGTFRLIGKLSSTDLLPTPTESIRENAYLILSGEDYHLYVITGDTELVWEDVGPISIQGTEVIANPAVSESDPDLTSVSIDGSLYNIPYVEVMANTDVTATDVLTNLYVDDTSYSLPYVRTDLTSYQTISGGFSATAYQVQGSGKYNAQGVDSGLYLYSPGAKILIRSGLADRSRPHVTDEADGVYLNFYGSDEPSTGTLDAPLTLATREYVASKYVDTSTAQTVGGSKTFTNGQVFGDVIRFTNSYGRIDFRRSSPTYSDFINRGTNSSGSTVEMYYNLPTDESDTSAGDAHTLATREWVEANVSGRTTLGTITGAAVGSITLGFTPTIGSTQFKFDITLPGGSVYLQEIVEPTGNYIRTPIWYEDTVYFLETRLTETDGAYSLYVNIVNASGDEFGDAAQCTIDITAYDY